MKAIVSLSLLIIVGAAFFAAAEDKYSAAKIARNTAMEKLPAATNEKPAKFKIDIVPTYGALGSRRSATFIEGEALTFCYSVSKLSAQDNFETGLVFSLQDATGNREGQTYSYFLNKDNLQFGGALISTSAKFPSPKAGKYSVQLKVIDTLNGENEIKEYPFEVLPKDTFGATYLGFYADEKGTLPSNGNLTAGETRHLFALINGLGTEGNRIHIKSTLSTLDHDKNLLSNRTLEYHDEMPPGGSHVHFYFTPNRPGSFYVRLEIHDCINDKTVTYDLPVKVSMPLGMEEDKP
jgi:hypothetical protein